MGYPKDSSIVCHLFQSPSYDNRDLRAVRILCRSSKVENLLTAAYKKRFKASQGLWKPSLSNKRDTERPVLTFATCFTILATIGEIYAQYVSSVSA